MKNKKLLVCLLVMIMMVFAASAAMAVTVSSEADLREQIAAGATEIVIDTDLELDGTTEQRIIIDSGKNITLSSTETVTITNYIPDLFEVQAGGTLTLKRNIIIDSTTSILWANGGTINVNGAVLQTTGSDNNAVYIASNGTLNMSSGEINATNSKATISVSGATAEITGGRVSSTQTQAIISKANAVVTISDRAFVETTAAPSANGVWAAALAKNGGTINVTGGTLQSMQGVAISAFTEKSGGSVNISGGNLTGGAYSVHQSNGASMEISGGYFNDDKFQDYIVDGLQMVTVNGKYTVGTPNYQYHPKTGDETNLVLLAVLLVASALGMTFMRKKACR